MNFVKNKLFIVSGPSGAGKGTLISEAIKRVPNLFISVSATTRNPRENEINGVHYYFISEAEFKEKIAKKAFLEYALVYDSYYGTLKQPIIKALKKGLTVLLEIDVQGAQQLKKSYPGKATFIFVFPPTFEELKKRLVKRRTEKGKDLELRLKVAKEEVKLVEEYDFVIINDNLQKATAQLIDIIKKGGKDA